MSLKPLIQGQTIIIDDHRRGNGEVKDWDDHTADIHIDKSTHYKVNGKRRNIRIKIPINSDQPIKVETKGKGKALEKIPSGLLREIQSAFSNREIRDEFITDVLKTLKTFDSTLDSIRKAKQVIERLAAHFDLKWTEESNSSKDGDQLMRYVQIYRDDAGNRFFISLDLERIKIGELDQLYRLRIPIK